MTHRQLRYWFGKFNRDYFDGKLLQPQRFGFSSKWDSIGRTEMDMFYIGKKPPARKMIFNRRIKWAECLVLMTMLHEMIHIKHPGSACNSVRSGISKTFKKEIRRLARAGAFDRWL